MYHQNSIQNLPLVVISKSKSNPRRVHINTKIFKTTITKPCFRTYQN